MKAATCTPIAFKADAHFFGRDSGLLCRGFQQIGIDCVSIMPGIHAADDAVDLIRTTPENLALASWWRSLALDIVILYAWGDPRYRPIAEAIQDAGIRLVQSLDTAGLVTPYDDFPVWFSCITATAAMPQPWSQRLRVLAKSIRDTIPSLYERKRLAMINLSDLVAVVSPPALECVRGYAEALGFSQVADKLAVIPHPVPSIMTYGGATKENIVLTVGRWEAPDRTQKNPDKLIAVLEQFLSENPEWRAEIVGRGSPGLSALCARWKPETRDRLILTSALTREELLGKYESCKIHFCPSRYESFHIASAEAVCCGASVVVGKHPLLASTSWFTTRNSGTLASSCGILALTQALNEEASNWKQGKRDPASISKSWQNTLHSHHIASNILTSVTT